MLKRDNFRRVDLGHDPGVCGYTTAALIRTAMGYFDHGNQEMEAALQLARELDHIPTVIHARFGVPQSYARCDASRKRWRSSQRSFFRCCHSMGLP